MEDKVNREKEQQDFQEIREKKKKEDELEKLREV